MFINDKNKVYFFGDNKYGQLGLGDKLNTNTPEIIDTISNIKCIAKGFGHTLFLDFDGIIYSCGYNSGGQLGLGHKQDISIPTKIPFNTKVTYISCGSFHSIIIDENNDVYVFGSNSWGQLGLGHNNSVIKPIGLGLKAVKVFCGGFYTFLIDINLNIWCFGNNHCGQLGLGNNIHYNVPTKFEFITAEIVDIKCGDIHTIFLDIEGNIYSFGNNSLDPLGIFGNANYNVPQNVKINNIDIQPLWKKIEAGLYHNLLLDNEGFVYCFGANFYGQLGLGHNNEMNEPAKIMNLPHIIDILCYSNSSFLLDINCEVWCFGFNENGKLGLGHNTNVSTPTINPNLIGIVKLNENNDIRFKNTKSARNNILTFEN